MSNIIRKIVILVKGQKLLVGRLKITSNCIYYIPNILTKSREGEDLNYKVNAGSIDHFSFYFDGETHVKYKNQNRTPKGIHGTLLLREQLNFPSGPIPNNSNQINHLVIDSVYQVNKLWQMSELSEEDSFDVLRVCPTWNQFSLLITVQHASTNIHDFLNSIGVNNVRAFIDYIEVSFMDCKVCLYFTDQTMPYILPSGLKKYNLSFQDGKEERFSRHIIVPPTKLAYEHLSLTRSLIL